MAKNNTFEKNNILIIDEKTNQDSSVSKDNLNEENIFDFSSIDNFIQRRNSNLKSKDKDLCDDIEINKIPTTLEEIEMQIDRLKQRWGEVTYLIGERLKYINDNRLFEQKGYTDFKTYVNCALKMSENNAYYYIAICEYFTPQETRVAGSKLKLIIPILNKIKRDKELPEDIKISQIKDLKDELITKIYTKTYREAEKIIDEIREKYFATIEDLNKNLTEEKIIILKDRIIIKEDDRDIQTKLVKLIEEFYKENAL